MSDREQEKEQFIDIKKMSVPKGGGAYQGLKEDFSVDLFTGESRISIPIYTSPCRDYEPILNLNYQASVGNGTFGFGFFMDMLSVSRRTSKQIPKYKDDEDIFMLSSQGELVLQAIFTDQDGFSVRTYNLKNESSFSEIAYYKKAEESYWKITDRDNTIIYFGKSKLSRISHPDNDEKIFSWLMNEKIDEKGNRTQFVYNDNKHIKSIHYGNYHSELEGESFAFSVEFHYLEQRADPFSKYNSGFKIETTCLCNEIQMVHHFEQKREIVRKTQFEYDKNSSVSLLQGIQVTGFKYLENREPIIEKMPCMRFSFTSFEPLNQQFFRLQVEGDIPFSMNKRGFSLMDLHGEGVQGLLYTDSKSAVYFEPLGDYQYKTPCVQERFPIHTKGSYSIRSLKGNGKYELVVEDPNVQGFYECVNGSFQSFQSFVMTTNEQIYEKKEIVDLQGDRLGHVMVSENEKLRYYPSLKEQGVDNPVVRKLPKNFPHVTQNSPKEVVTFLDLFGDGLPHRVRIKNGSVECWPNMGYGNFGDKITIENPPVTEGEFDASRLFFADLDGSGTVDFIYLYQDKAALYLNQGGNHFSDPLFLKLPEIYTKEDQISFGDVNGTGTNCLVFSKTGIEAKHYCYDFSAEKKPYMLNEIHNGMGSQTKMQYESSVSLYLKDKRNQVPWNSTIPFPVQLLVEKKTIDEISGSIYSSKYHYRDGLYDFEDNYFKGFGFVEQRDTEYVTGYSGKIPEIYTRNWYYTGMDHADDYFAGDKEALKMEEHLFETTNLASAKKALYGRLLRSEMYEDGYQNPVKVEENNYRVVEIKAPEKGQYGSYFSHICQTITYQYEKDVTDPSVKHQFYLDVDEFGNVITNCEVYYQRRRPDNDACYDWIKSAQTKLSIKAVVNQYINSINGTRHLGVLYEKKSFEIEGVECSNYFTKDSLYEGMKSAMEHIVPFGESFQGNVEQARLLEWRRYYYWDDAFTEQLSLGQIGLRALQHHEEMAIFPEQFAVIKDKINEKSLITDCGYKKNQEYWWKEGLTKYYYQQDFYYLPYKEACLTKKHCTTVLYDKYALLPVEYNRYIDVNTSMNDLYSMDNQYSLTTSATIDYSVLFYKEIKDENDNVSQAMYDPFGQIIASTGYGIVNEEVEGDGDMEDYTFLTASAEDVLKKPEKYLQNMTCYYYYDLLAFQRDGQPVRSIALLRSDFISSKQDCVINASIVYWNGFLRKFEEKEKADQETWTVKNRTIYNSYNKALMVYPSFFSKVPAYEYEDISIPPIIYQYDYQQRVIETKTPKSGIVGVDYEYVNTVTEYGTWEQIIYNENSCLLDTDYYKEYMKHYPKNPTIKQSDQYEVLKKSIPLHKKASIHVFDSRGNTIAHIVNPETKDFVKYDFDINGNITAIADARLRKNGACNIRYIYDMQGNAIYTDSCDAGSALTIRDAFDQVVHHINGNGSHTITYYDSLSRPVKKYEKDIGLIEKIEYGEGTRDAKEKNLAGKIYKYQDQAGVETSVLYSVIGLVKEKRRQLCSDYKNRIDWTEDVALEEEIYTESFEYNTSEQVTVHRVPDGTVYVNSYGYLGQLKKVAVESLEEGKRIVEDIKYNAEGKRECILYGNEVATTYRYDPITLLLERVVSERVTAEKKEIIQDLTYYFDPVANVSRIRDNTTKERYSHQQVTLPVCDYIYDEYNRLILGTGRELAGHEHDMENIVTYKQEYTYDLSNNMTILKHTSPTRSFTRNMEMPEGSNRMSQVNDGNTITYDSCGNMNDLPGIEKLLWNSDNQLTCAVVKERIDEDNDEEHYVYDHNGIRIQKVTLRKINDNQWEQTQKVYIGSYSEKKIITDHVKLHRIDMRITEGEIPIATVYHWLIDEGDRETKETNEKKIHYQLENHLNSISVVLNDQAELIHVEEYYPFGGTALNWDTKCEVNIKEYRFCNKELDSTGLYYYQSRYYAQDYGRMISADSVEYIKPEDWQTLNLYCYCKNNPVTYTDPDGHDWKKALLVVSSILTLGLVALVYGIYQCCKPAAPPPPPPPPPMPPVPLGPGLAAHIQAVDTTVPRRNGIGGAHQSTAFNAEATRLGVQIVDNDPVPGIAGVYRVTYQIPRVDMRGNPVVDGTGNPVFNARTYQKTIYDPAILTDADYLRRGTEAAQDAMNRGVLTREWTGTDALGIQWRGYLNQAQNHVVSFFPDP